MARTRSSPENAESDPPETKGGSGGARRLENDVNAAGKHHERGEVAVADAPHGEHDVPAADDAPPRGIARRVRQRLAAVGEHLPAPVRRRLPRLTRWRLALLAGILLLMLLWFGVAATSTSIYSATVLVTETRHGIADPGALFDFGDLPPTAAIDHKLTLKNDGRLDTYVTIMVFGGIRDFLDVEDAFFNLKSGEERDILVKLSVPSTAEPGKQYDGRVVVTRLPWGLPW